MIQVNSDGTYTVIGMFQGREVEETFAHKFEAMACDAQLSMVEKLETDE